MKITAVISEFDPFHNGHKYLIDCLRESGSTHIISIMSGNFTQRGQAAMFDKYTRTKAALACGADLVSELPVSFACSGAERFAYGGVFIADSLGCVDTLAFGSECGDIDLLKNAADAVTDRSADKVIRDLLGSGMTFAAAREQAVRKLYGSVPADVLSSPNNILAVEYIKALRHINSIIRPETIKRTGAEHDSNETVGNIASASYIRSLYESGDQGTVSFLPENVRVLYSDPENRPPLYGRQKKTEMMMLYRLRTMSAADFAALPDVSEGLENRLYDAVRSSECVEEIILRTKSKRYTRSRIMRILTSAFLGMTKDSIPSKPLYIRVLGMNSKGTEVLRIAKKTAVLPIVMRYSDTYADPEAKKMYEFESLCDDIYALSGDMVYPCGSYMTNKVIRV